MGRVIWHVSMSVDGFIAGPDHSMDRVVGAWSEGGAKAATSSSSVPPWRTLVGPTGPLTDLRFSVRRSR